MDEYGIGKKQMKLLRKRERESIVSELEWLRGNHKDLLHEYFAEKSRNSRLEKELKDIKEKIAALHQQMVKDVSDMQNLSEMIKELQALSIKLFSEKK